jgi:hypothetical protein
MWHRSLQPSLWRIFFMLLRAQIKTRHSPKLAIMCLIRKLSQRPLNSEWS